MKPISPEELMPNIPEFVINCINNLIRQKFNYFSTGWLHFEDMYRDADWTVRKSWNASSEKMEYVFEKKE